MINTLIVDDENLVRKWLIFSIKDSESGIRVVGDVASGAKALDFLAESDVQLVITDLTMPSMSGFELMEQIRERHPLVKFVVLTCHQDFHYIQDAMRLGAIDYIVKTQLEQEQVEDVLRRIAERIERDDAARGPAAAGQAVTEPGSGLLLVRASPAGAGGAPVPPPEWGKAASVDASSWWLPRSSADERAFNEWTASQDREWLAFRVDVSAAQTVREMDSLKLRAWKDDVAFYWGGGGGSPAWIPVSGSLADGDANVRFGQARESWTSFDWLLSEAAYERLLDRIHANRPPSGALVAMLRAAAVGWSHIERLPGAEDWPARTEAFRYWEEWARWLNEARDSIAAHAEKCSYSPEIFTAIFRAIDAMKNRLEEGAHQQDIAQRVNLSRGYFSDCFKEVAGKPFSDYLKLLKLDRAKELLEETNDPIYAVSQRSGFQDEKYFSRVFKEHAGVLPSEYRARMRRVNGANR
ncbi:response regulator [Cohnella sp. GCM10027633]|uniref:response regulator transcription factor n=1 Tax=unclassified Cohnella TaxID=2636738 RepID=UPI003641C185